MTTRDFDIPHLTAAGATYAILTETVTIKKVSLGMSRGNSNALFQVPKRAISDAQLYKSTQ